MERGTAPAPAAGAGRNSNKNGDNNRMFVGGTEFGAAASKGAAAGGGTRHSPYTTTYPNLNKLLLFEDPTHRLDFKAWKRRTLSIAVTMVLMTAVGVLHMVSRFNWPWFGPDTETTAQFVGQLSLVPLNVLFALYVGSLVYVHTCDFDSSRSSVPIDTMLFSTVLPVLCQLFVPGPSNVSTRPWNAIRVSLVLTTPLALRVHFF